MNPEEIVIAQTITVLEELTPLELATLRIWYEFKQPRLKELPFYAKVECIITEENGTKMHSLVEGAFFAYVVKRLEEA